MLARSLHWALLRLRYALFRRRILVKAVNRGVIGGDRLADLGLEAGHAFP